MGYSHVYVLVVVVLYVCLCGAFPNVECPNDGIYISPFGSNTTGNGSKNNPFQSIDDALNFLKNESGTICAESGNYTTEGVYYLNSSITIVAVDPNNPPFFSSLDFNISKQSLVLDNLNFASFVLLNYEGTLIMTNSISPEAAIYIFLYSTYSNVTISNVNVDMIGYFQLGNYNESTDILTINSSIIGSRGIQFKRPNGVLSLESCTISGPVQLRVVSSLVKGNTFINVNSNNVLSYDDTGIQSPSHIIQNNTFMNNTFQEYVVYFGYSYLVVSTVEFSGNYFSCNKNSSETAISISYYNINFTKFENNSMNPACPYSCLPGNEPYLSGLGGCTQCKLGWYSPGNTTQCLPCPAGTYENQGINCTMCGEGQYSELNSTICVTCPKGTPSTNHSTCVPCPSYHYSLYDGICHQCELGDVYEGCDSCGWFLSGNDCKSLSLYGIILIATLGVILTVILVGLVYHRMKKRRGYKGIN